MSTYIDMRKENPNSIQLQRTWILAMLLNVSHSNWRNVDCSCLPNNVDIHGLYINYALKIFYRLPVIMLISIMVINSRIIFLCWKSNTNSILFQFLKNKHWWCLLGTRIVMTFWFLTRFIMITLGRTTMSVMWHWRAFTRFW